MPLKSQAMDPQALFVYGSLIDHDRRLEIVGRPVRAVAARLPGYERGRARYFYIVPKVGEEVAGLILMDLTAEDFSRLDRCEEVPRLYTRELITAIDRAGSAIGCWCYLPASGSITQA